MLRRVARVARAGVVVVGVMLVAWLPLSFLLQVRLAFPYPSGYASLGVYRGAVAWTLVRLPNYPGSFTLDIGRPDWDIERRGWALPSWSDDGLVARLDLPLWLLAAICLAWPVTSFILARRRAKGRGFAVEAGGGGPAPGIDPPPRRPDNIP